MVPTVITDGLKKSEGYLRAFSLNLTQDPQDAQDLYQETLIRICKNADKYEPNTNFKAWSSTIMKNVFINDYRKKSRRKLILDHSVSHYVLNQNRRNDCNEGEQNVHYKELLKLVNQVPNEFRIPFWMAYQGYRYEEIAEYLGVPLGTIKSRIYFAKRKIRRLYELEHFVRA
ncbi:MAG: RNA polymerase sigma factor [Bacteroidota bacterium]